MPRLLPICFAFSAADILAGDDTPETGVSPLVLTDDGLFLSFLVPYVALCGDPKGDD